LRPRGGDQACSNKTSRSASLHQSALLLNASLQVLTATKAYQSGTGRGLGVKKFRGCRLRFGEKSPRLRAAVGKKSSPARQHARILFTLE